MEVLDDVIVGLRKMHQPVIAAVNGAAIGGGFCLSLAADIRLASDAAYFRAAGINNGLTSTELGISFLLPRAIGSSSQMPATSRDAPPAVAATLSFNNAMASLSDFLFSGVLVRFPRLTLAYSEGQIGWLPYLLERADDVWREHRAWGGVKDIVPEPPSTYYYRQVFGCFFRDRHGLESLHRVGIDNTTFETDYPHTDSTWPETKRVAEEMMAGLPDDVISKIVRGNAIRMLELDLA